LHERLVGLQGSFGRKLVQLCVFGLPASESGVDIIQFQPAEVFTKSENGRANKSDVLVGLAAVAVPEFQEVAENRMLIARPIHLAGVKEFDLARGDSKVSRVGEPQREFAFGQGEVAAVLFGNSLKEFQFFGVIENSRSGYGL
jgi:hypothetical protein